MQAKNSIMQTWEALHAMSAAERTLPGPVANAWLRSDSYAVDPQNALPPSVPPAVFEQIKQDTKRLYIYGGSIIGPLVAAPGNKYGALMFDKTGCLLRIYGNPAFLRWAEKHNIRPATRWLEGAIGANAVSVGMHEEAAVQLEPHQNYARFLIGGRYAYSPIKLESGRLIGGLALAAPAEAGVQNLAELALTIARAVELQFFWFETAIGRGSIGEGTGVLTVEQSNKQNRVLIVSEETTKILGLPQKDYFYEKLENLIEDIPANRAFWDIVKTNTKVVDRPLTVTVRGKQVPVSISVTLLREKKFHMQGININFNSIKRIGRLISQYSGNAARFGFDDVLGESEAMREAVRRAKTASLTDSSVLLQGESGVGKDVIAQAIHNNSGRKNHPFVALNSAGFSKELIASELFGYESGAFTGASKNGAVGKFELANNGTLFLDEIGDMPLDLQAILLRVLEEKSFRKVGGNELIHVNVRIIAATNMNLTERIASGLFREDLFYRLGIVRIHIPPLRGRGPDILQLADHFIGHICTRLDKPRVGLSDSARAYLLDYGWPGNVRELQNLLEGIISTSDDPVINRQEIVGYLGNFQGLREAAVPPVPAAPAYDIEDYTYDERREMVQSLKKSNNNKTRAAALMNMPLSTFYRRLKKYGIF